MLHKGRSSRDYASLHENLQYLHRQTASRSDVFDISCPYSVLSCSQILERAKPPEHYIRDHEERFRKGFYHGYTEALDHLLYLKRKGFLRPTEIYNILYGFAETMLIKWWKRWNQEDHTDGNYHYGTPRFKHESWSQIRAQVFERDGKRCGGCGSPLKLEADHIIPVCEGGLPELDNLQTLCKTCHRGGEDDVSG